MKAGRLFSLISGSLFLILGVASLVPSLVKSGKPILEVSTSFGTIETYGYLLGLFPVNTVEAIFYLVFGVFGLASAVALDSSRFYAGFTAVVFGTLAILGLIPIANTVFGLFPVYGSDVWLHASVAIVATYFGFLATPNLLELLQAKESA
ncbi:MAG: DUF4383 domain-containing protein [Waterburya sp.]